MSASSDPGLERGPALRHPAHQVSPKARLLWTVSAALQEVTLLVILVVVNVLGWWDVPVWVWVLYAVAAIGYVAVQPTLRYRVHRWESTETAVYTQTGWLSRERRIAPMSRAQTVDLEQSAVGRLLGLASVTVTTASAAGPLKIDGLDQDVAERLVGDLTRRMEADPGDAT